MTGKEEIVGIVYHPDYLIHTRDQHPERRERLEHIITAIRENDLDNRVEMIEPSPASVGDIALVHDSGYIGSIEKACREDRGYLDMDTYIVPESYRVALLSAGGALTGLNRIFAGEMNRVFVLNRPPGHHAERGRAMGFCLFNNVAVAAEAARRNHGLTRIAIVDWDVHHGNGTQHAFEETKEVLFISTHQSPAYPGTGGVRETGRGEGAGFTVNIPLPAGCGDSEYSLCFERLVIPILDQYRPELLIVSAGQDAYYQDPLAGMALTRRGYHNLAQDLTGVADRWAKGRILLCLEGGYHLQGQAGAVIQVLNALGGWGLPLPDEEPRGRARGSVPELLKEIREVQKQYWDL